MRDLQTSVNVPIERLTEIGNDMITAMENNHRFNEETDRVQIYIYDGSSAGISISGYGDDYAEVTQKALGDILGSCIKQFEAEGLHLSFKVKKLG